MSIRSKLIEKYNIPAPRYTSFPAVPYWNAEDFSVDAWQQHVKATFARENQISLYIHLPFCSQLCTYCGCHKRITKNHGYEMPYISSLLQEWQMYVDLLEAPPVIRELHLGGGTPTFFSPDNLNTLITGILKNANVAGDAMFSFEAHPANTSFSHLESLYKAGFRRVSFGVQDFSEDILKLINRTQTSEQVITLTKQARALGYTSINYDLIYGLPRQTLQHIQNSLDHIEVLRPERIAFYSYAHVPWKKPSQRAYSEKDLPQGTDKQALFDTGKERLLEMGYCAIGMDHFTLEGDELNKAQINGQLHRNFMGYTPHNDPLLIGLGASAISDSWTAFSQNEKNIEEYQKLVKAGVFPGFRGHLLKPSELIIRQHILNLMCNYYTKWSDQEAKNSILQAGLNRLQSLERDGLLKISNSSVEVLPAGKPFVRNICMALDHLYWEHMREQPGRSSRVI